ncbi:MAG: hypothetical protein M1838_000331 [Thelocarpon superellum]|nr:MAG: hypothetical protein M1838_000331 [Thelocarpon superellum]
MSARANTTASQAGAAQDATRTQVANLLSELRLDLTERNLSASARLDSLQQLKVHGRKVGDAGPIFTAEGVHTLTGHGVDANDDDPPSSLEALRCLVNALILAPATRQMLVDVGFAGKAARRLQHADDDEEFLFSRLLFLLTYGTNLDLSGLIDQDGLASAINTNISRHAQRYGDGNISDTSTDDDSEAATAEEEMALSETLTLLFNVTHFCPGRTSAFAPSMLPILAILSQHAIPSPPLQRPITSLINALINLDIEPPSAGEGDQTLAIPELDQQLVTRRLIEILSQSINDYPEQELDQTAAPLVTLLRKIYEMAPGPLQSLLQAQLLPSDEERNQPLGKSDTLPSRLLRLTTSAMLPSLRDNLSALLFELSNKDAETFVHNVGYGYASGYLMTHNLPIPDQALRDPSARPPHTGGEASGSSSSSSAPINPITGQRISAEEPVDLLEMTDEEKEREAERLFILFERLKKTGIIDVKNPVEQAIDEGRFEELD